MERSGNAPYKEIYNIAHNIIGFEGIVKGDLTACQVPCYFEILQGPRIRGFKGSSVFIMIMIILVKSFPLASLNPGTLDALNPYSKGVNP